MALALVVNLFLGITLCIEEVKNHWLHSLLGMRLPKLIKLRNELISCRGTSIVSSICIVALGKHGRRLLILAILSWRCRLVKC